MLPFSKTSETKEKSQSPRDEEVENLKEELKDIEDELGEPSSGHKEDIDKEEESVDGGKVDTADTSVDELTSLDTEVGQDEMEDLLQEVQGTVMDEGSDIEIEGCNDKIGVEESQTRETDQDDGEDEDSIETGADGLLSFLNEKQKISVSKAADKLELPEETVEVWGRALEAKGYIDINYSVIRGKVMSLNEEVSEEEMDVSAEGSGEEVSEQNLDSGSSVLGGSGGKDDSEDKSQNHSNEKFNGAERMVDHTETGQGELADLDADELKNLLAETYEDDKEVEITEYKFRNPDSISEIWSAVHGEKQEERGKEDAKKQKILKALSHAIEQGKSREIDSGGKAKSSVDREEELAREVRNIQKRLDSVREVEEKSVIQGQDNSEKIRDESESIEKIYEELEKREEKDEEQRKKFEEEIRNLQEIIKEEREEREKKIRKKIEQEYSELNKKIESLEQKIEDSHDQERTEEIQEEVEKLEQKVGDREQEEKIRQLQEEIENLEKTIEEKNNKDEIEKIKTEIGEVEEKMNESEDKEELEEEIENRYSELESKLDEIRETQESKINKVEERKEELENRLEDLQSQMEELKQEEVEDTQSQLEDIEEKYNRLENRIEGLQSSKRNGEEDLETKTEQIESEYQHLNSKIENLEEEIVDKKTENSKKNSKPSSTEESLSEKPDESKSEKRRGQSENWNEYKDEVEKLNEQLKDIQSQDEANKNISDGESAEAEEIKKRERDGLAEKPTEDTLEEQKSNVNSEQTHSSEELGEDEEQDKNKDDSTEIGSKTNDEDESESDIFNKMDTLKDDLKKINPDYHAEHELENESSQKEINEDEIDNQLKKMLENIKEYARKLKNNPNSTEDVYKDLKIQVSSLQVYLRINNLNEREKEKADSVMRYLEREDIDFSDSSASNNSSFMDKIDRAVRMYSF